MFKTKNQIMRETLKVNKRCALVSVKNSFVA